jgi:polysaccharide pyruvyl transferase WcaK-like protein
LRQSWVAARSDIVVFSAGSIFAGPHDGQWRRLLRSVRAADKLRKIHTTVVGLGISIGPFASASEEDLTKDALRLFDRILLRDDESLHVASKMGLTNVAASFDIASTLYEAICTTEKRSERFVLGIALGPGFHRESAEAFHAWVNALDQQCLSALRSRERHLHIRIFSTCNSPVDGDNGVARSLAQEMHQRGWKPELMPYTAQAADSFWAELLDCDGLISSRLHPSLVALGAGIPVMQLFSTAPKVRGVFQRLGVSPEVLTVERFATPSEWQRFTTQVDTRIRSEMNRTAFAHAGERCSAQIQAIFATNFQR